MASRSAESPRVEDGGRVGPSLGIILGVGLIARVVAAVVVQRYADRVGKVCVFGDTAIYWDLARSIRLGRPFVVDQSGVPHYALRTPGYPAFLAACQAIFGESAIAVRLVQAIWGTIGVGFLYGLVCRVIPGSGRGVALVAAGLAAVEPYGVGLGALVLSEGVFVPLMLGGLWGLAELWGPGSLSAKRRAIVAILTGLAHGAAILVRPSWAIAVPVGLVALWAGSGWRWASARDATIVAVAVALVMLPWWARNARIFGRFVPTAVWVGASLYDGVSPVADGSSAMEFLAEPEFVGLDETTQDRTLLDRSIRFARAHPGRFLALAAIKAGRFWSPWPNAETLRSTAASWASAIVTLPLFALAAVGFWDRRGDPRAIALLAGPLLIFLALHVIFVSSIRYRIPGFVPMLGLVAVGVRRLVPSGFGGREPVP